MNMTYDFSFFDEIIDRRGTNCYKWDHLIAEQGRELLPMWVADMDFRCPAEVQEALIARANHPIYGYTEHSHAAIDAMLAFMQRHHQVTLTHEQQVTLPCVVTGLRTAVRALTQPGDPVLIQSPVYGPFFAVVKDNDRILVENKLVADAQGRYTMDYASMETAFAQGVKLALLCSPHNPVGRVWTLEELTRVYALCKQYDVTLVVDEIHSDFVYARGSFTNALRLDESEQAKIIVITSASKTFNLAGLHQAVLLTRNQTLKKALVNEMRNVGIVAGNIFSYLATEAAYQHGDAWLAGMLAYLSAGRKLLMDELQRRLPAAIMSPLEATYLAWIDLRAYGLTTAELMARTYEQDVAFSSGTAFDSTLGEGFLRFNFACPHSQILEAVKRLEKALKGRTN